MKRDAWITVALAALIGALLALGGTGCLISGFGLTIAKPANLLCLCLVSSAVCALAFSRKRGGVILLLASGLLLGYLWRQGETLAQLRQLCYRISAVYNRAYHWGVLKWTNTPWDAGQADLPMAILGALLAAAGARAVCRSKGALIPILLASLPLGLCLVVTDTVPGIPYLFSLFLGQILLLLTSHVRKLNSAQGNRLMLAALLPTAAALGILFLLLPQKSYVNQSAQLQETILTWLRELPQSVEAHTQGLNVNFQAVQPSTVGLTNLGPRHENTSPVMEVTAETGGTIYLRGQDYDSYDGRDWSSSRHRVEEFSIEGRNLGYVSITTHSRMDTLYLPYYPAGGQSFIGGRIENTRLATSYSFLRIGLPTGQADPSPREDSQLPVAGVGGDPAEDMRYLALPQQTQARAQVLLEPILAGKDSAAEKAQAIAAFVRNSAVYDLSPERMPGDQADFALWFLEEADRGYCIHFATAATVLLRAAGVEARYVSGYMVTLEPEQSTAVTGANAHAWAEYYDPAWNAWRVLEATPGAAGPSETPTAQDPSVPPTTHPQETAPGEPSGDTTVPSPTFPTETAPLPEPEVPAVRRPGPLLDILATVLGLAAIAASLYIQRLVRRQLRRRQQATGPINSQALALWQEAVLLAKRLGTQPPAELEELAIKAKFSQHTLTPEELAIFQLYLRDALRQLGQMPWYRRLVDQYIYALY